jgi:hypothetical protein
LHPANELDNPFDDIDDSSLAFDNDPIVIELVANAFDQITHDIQMDTAPQPPPPVVTPTDPPVQGVNYEVCREKLNEYFLKRFTDNTCELWKKGSKFPRAGDDTEFDKMLEELGITNNRRYASGKWTEFKAARGIVPPPKFVCEASEFETVASKVVALEIVEAAIKKTEELLMDGTARTSYEWSLFIANCPPIQEHLKQEVFRFTNGLMEALDGGQPNTIDDRVNTHLRKIKKDMRQELIDKVHELFPSTNAINVNIFFGELHTQLYEKYKDKIAEYTTPHMEHDVPDSVVKDHLSGSEDTLCYVSGWFLTAILNLVMANVDKGTLQKFVAENSTTKNETNDSMPTGVIDQREKRGDALRLRRPGDAWYHFVACLKHCSL